MMKRIISMATLLTVLSLVTFGARFAVTKGLESKSNRQLAIEIIDRTEAPVLAKRQPSNEPVVLGSSTSDQAVIDANKLAACRVAVTSQIEKNNSIVDYMNQSGMDYTFEHRKFVAELKGIQNYQGTAEQNKKLIYLLAEETQCSKSAK